MGQLAYQVIERAIDEDTASVGAGTLIQIAAKGRKIRAVSILTVSPVTQPLRLHFGPNSDPVDVYQGNIFGDSAESAAVNAFDAGLFYSVPPGTVPANGALFRVMIEDVQ